MYFFFFFFFFVLPYSLIIIIVKFSPFLQESGRAEQCSESLFFIISSHTSARQGSAAAHVCVCVPPICNACAGILFSLLLLERYN